MIYETDGEVAFLAYQYLESQTDETVFKYLQDIDGKVRTIAGKVIQLRGSDDLFNQVITLKDADKYYLRENCAFVLGQFKTTRADFLAQIPPILFTLAQDKSVSVKTTAIYSFGHFYCYHPMRLPLSEIDQQVRQLILTNATHALPSVRTSCAYALASMPDDDEVRQTLNTLLYDEDIDVSEWAEVSLEILDDKKS